MDHRPGTKMWMESYNPFAPNNGQGKNSHPKKLNLVFCKILRNKYQVLPKRVHLNGNIIGFYPQI